MIGISPLSIPCADANMLVVVQQSTEQGTSAREAV